MNIEDEPAVDISTHFEESIKFVEEAVASGGKVLVHWYYYNIITSLIIIINDHSRAGISRSATMVAAYLMKHKKLTRDDCLEYPFLSSSLLLIYYIVIYLLPFYLFYLFDE